MGGLESPNSSMSCPDAPPITEIGRTESKRVCVRAVVAHHFLILITGQLADLSLRP